MAIKKSQMEAVKRYRGRHYWRVDFFCPSRREDDIKARAEALGLSVNAYINRLIYTDLGMTEAEWKEREEEE